MHTCDLFHGHSHPSCLVMSNTEAAGAMLTCERVPAGVVRANQGERAARTTPAGGTHKPVLTHVSWFIYEVTTFTNYSQMSRQHQMSASQQAGGYTPLARFTTCTGCCACEGVAAGHAVHLETLSPQAMPILLVKSLACLMTWD